MKSLVLLMLLLLAASVMAGEPAAAVRTEAFSLLQSLQASDVASTRREEFNSFATTVEEAEKLHLSGEDAAADQLFDLAILKGKLLLAAGQAAAGQTAPPAPVFSGISTASPAGVAELPQTAPAPPTAQRPETAEIPPERTLSRRIYGGEGIYSVRKGDTLRLVAARLGVRQKDLARMNHLKPDALLNPGQKLKYNNRQIVPKALDNGILVNIPDRRLYLFRNGRVSSSYPVALGISKKKESIAWRTPVGKFRIVDKKENPTWKIPLSIQKEMEENGEEVLEFVPPGPKNPLGKYALRTDLAGILIHSTTKPASINSFSSHGCIRVMPEHMELLFKAVTVPMQGEIIYQPVKVEVTGNGRVFLEVNRDSYEMIEDLDGEVRKAINRHHVASRVSWPRVKKVLSEKSGVAEDVTLPAMPANQGNR